MIRILLLLIAAVAFVSYLLGISAGWAWIIVLVVGAGFLAYQKPTARYVKPSALWKCPYCLKRTKLGATACHHCGRSLLQVPNS